MNAGEKAVLIQIQTGLSRVSRREEIIANKKVELSELKTDYDKYNEITEELKELKLENKNDRQFVQSSMEFYEAATGDTVGVGPLFDEEFPKL